MDDAVTMHRSDMPGGDLMRFVEGYTVHGIDRVGAEWQPVERGVDRRQQGC
jgi:hypothetical protein